MLLLCLNTHADILLMFCCLCLDLFILCLLFYFILFSFKQYHVYKWECCNKIVIGTSMGRSRDYGIVAEIGIRKARCVLKKKTINRKSLISELLRDCLSSVFIHAYVESS